MSFNESHFRKIAQELNLSVKQLTATVSLLEGGATIPFLARYRKEATGSLNEVVITSIRDRIQQQRGLEERRDVILDSLKKQGKLTEDLEERIQSAATLTVLEDLYLPFRPKRRTRATIAKEKGLEPLAKKILDQEPTIDPSREALRFVNPDKKVVSVKEALQGARDIIAEWVSEHPGARAKIRELFLTKGIFVSNVIKGKEKEGQKFKDYFDWQEPVKSAPSHRILALRRGEKEGMLSLRIQVPHQEAIDILEDIFIKGKGSASDQIREALGDGFKRLLSPSIETEVRHATKERADHEAIQVFAQNLRQLLMTPPVGEKAMLAIDPAFRTGCKMVVLDPQGKLLHHDTIYPFQSSGKSVA